LKIQTTDSNSRIEGTTEIVVVDGVGIFKDLTFISPPGTKNVKFEIYASTINTDVIRGNFNYTD
jgi:hypothetical protein